MLCKFTTFTLITAGAMVSTTFAAPTIFLGTDNSAGIASPRPNSDAARANFLTALGSGVLGTEGFEAEPIGNFNTRTTASGLTVTQVDYTTGTYSGISNQTGTATGYNTTPGGTQYLGMDPGSSSIPSYSQFDFPVSIDSFGLYVTGVGTVGGSNIFVEFNDGTLRNYTIPGATSGGISFFGFVGADMPITSVRLYDNNSVADFIGHDDLVWGAVPEPTSIAAIAAAGLLRLRRRK